MSSISINLEKAFFAKILSDNKQFTKVEDHFFDNAPIRLVFSILQEYFKTSNNKEIPSPNQIWTMVSMEDAEKIVSKEILKTILTVDIDDYDEDWLDDKFKAWKTAKYTRTQLAESIDLIREMDDIDFDTAMAIGARIRDNFKEIDSISSDDEDLGDDFDDPESHKQNISINKMPSGWSNVDLILGGGWDRATLNIIMGETSVGKSMWLQNITANLANTGYNVVYVTLEMSAAKTTKRMGSMRLKIDINEYDQKAKDSVFMKNKINEVKNLTPTNKLFDSVKPGKIYTKKYPTSDCTVTDLENYIKKFNQASGIKMDVMVIDYINLMSIEKGYDMANMLYLKGKHLSEGLRRLADKYEVAIITATQTDKSVWGASDINLDDIPESKAIAEAADSVWGIIRNSEMKKNNMYRLKILKLRDGENHAQQIKFDFNTKYLSIENDVLLTK